MNEVVILSEDISAPIDEGLKKFSFNFIKQFIPLNNQCTVFSNSINTEIENIKKLPTNRLFFSIRFILNILLIKPQQIIYIPNSSSTLLSFMRLWGASFFCFRAKKILISLQERKHGKIAQYFIKLIKPHLIVVLSEKEACYYKNLNINAFVSPVGVDTKQFNEISIIQKENLKTKLNLPTSGKIVLHVGHIRQSRNIEILKPLIKQGYNIVIIGSTCFESEQILKQKLEQEGFIIVNKFLEHIEEYYQASDLYAFPVQYSTSAIEFPLSVLEAMSCNIPVISTKFGGIENFIKESEFVKFFNGEKELLEKVNSIPDNIECKNRQIVISGFSWETITKRIFDKLNTI